MSGVKFNIGDVVVLKSGGPHMTIEGIIGDSRSPGQLKTIAYYSGFKSGDIYCVWFSAEGKKEHAFFKRQSVEK